MHNALKKFRLEHDLTQQELADNLLVSRQTIISIEEVWHVCLIARHTWHGGRLGFLFSLR